MGYSPTKKKREAMTKPKEEGGLGIRKARELNVSLIGKLGWDLMLGSDKL